MSDGISFDFSDLNTLIADLGAADEKIIPNVRKAVEVSARNVKDDARKDAKEQNTEHATRYAGSIDYDMKLDQNGVIGAEIGPKLGGRWGQGSLGILEDAPGGVRAKPQRSLQKAAKAVEKDFERGILKATEDLL